MTPGCTADCAAPPAGHKRRACLAFTSSTGETIAAQDVVCWRYLDGRPCLTAGQRATAASVQAVVIPIAPGRPSKPLTLEFRSSAPDEPAHAINGDSGGKGDATATATALPANALPLAAALPPDISHDPKMAVAASAAALAAALREAGMATALDNDGRLTAGAKFHKWEGMGVACRLEVGPSEAAAGACCLAVQTAGLGEEQTEALQRELMATITGVAAPCGEQQQQQTQRQVQAAECVEAPAAQRRGTLRLRGVPASRAAAAVRCAVDYLARSALSRDEESVAEPSSASGAAACEKLHIFAGSVAAAEGVGSTDGSRGDASGIDASHGGSSSTSCGVTAAGVAGGSAPTAVCGAHLRRLLVKGAKRCHCTHAAHVSLQQACHEIQTMYERRNGATVTGWLHHAAEGAYLAPHVRMSHDCFGCRGAFEAPA